jgi:2-polyprenyl-3-methyl-5-hydroxy-6-metoxy-1,4-benzoquinol methylase
MPDQEQRPDVLRNETTAAVYDDMYAGRIGVPGGHQPYSGYDLPYWKSHYYPLWLRVCQEVMRRQSTSVLEVGCGSGSFAHMLFDRSDVKYLGFDFSREAIMKARKRTGRDDAFVVSRAEDELAKRLPSDTIVCLEVLEHIERDLDVVSTWRPGTRCICSVPNFDQPDHVRYFVDEDSVKARYGALIEIDTIERVPRALVRGRGWKAYFQQLVWARAEPRKLLGLLGYRTFDSISGWILFSGIRRG